MTRILNAIKIEKALKSDDLLVPLQNTGRDFFFIADKGKEYMTAVIRMER